MHTCEIVDIMRSYYSEVVIAILHALLVDVYLIAINKSKEIQVPFTFKIMWQQR